MWVAEWWARVPVRRYRWAAWLAAIAVMVGGLWRVETTATKAETAVAAVKVQQELESARFCVALWDSRLGVRELIAGLIAASTTADPSRVQAFEEDMARRLPDPDCDLEAAQQVVHELDP